jgi:CRISPR/Cas system-associated protein Csm6
MGSVLGLSRSWVRAAIQLGQTKDSEIGICVFLCYARSIKEQNKDGLVRHQDNVSECGDMSIRGLLLVRTSTTKRVGLVQSGPHHHFIEN